MDPKRLREETRAEHEATEAAVPLMAPGLTRSQYGEVLRALLPIVSSWESWAAQAAPVPLQGMVQERRRSHLLLQDLQGLELAEANTPLQRLPDWATVVTGAVNPWETDRSSTAYLAAFLGAMYVMEGSTLGGRFIARHVEAALQLTPGQGNAYFDGHGQSTGRLWREVSAQIAAVPEEWSSLLVETTRRAFIAFGDALRQGLPAH